MEAGGILVPQLLQNRLPSVSAAPQVGQVRPALGAVFMEAGGILVPQLLQNWEPFCTSAPQLGHFSTPLRVFI